VKKREWPVAYFLFAILIARPASVQSASASTAQADAPFAASSEAQSSAQTGAPPATRIEAPKRPAFTFTFTERIRQETSDNVTSLNDSLPESSSYVRFRTSLMGQWRPAEGFELAVRVTNENRYYLAPKSDPKLHKNYDPNEVFFDNFYLKWTPGKLPLTITFGRQDIQLGEGFLFMDGGPLDGSRSAYFNALRLDFALGGGATLTGFYLRQPPSDAYLPRLHDVAQKMVEQEEAGFGAYLTGAPGSWNYEIYLFRKNMEASDASPRSGFTTTGGRVRIPFAENLSLTAEAALQTGTYGALSRLGWGGYFHLDWKTGASLPFPALLTFGGIYLSGDDLSTADTYEGWDPAFSRWPKWSESLIYLLARESRPAYWSNFNSLYASAQFAFADAVKLNLTWHHLGAGQRTAPTALLSGHGTRRGDLGIAKLTYEINKNFQGHFIWDQFRPGDFFFAGAQSYAWVRFELLIKY